MNSKITDDGREPDGYKEHPETPEMINEPGPANAAGGGGNAIADNDPSVAKGEKLYKKIIHAVFVKKYAIVNEKHDAWLMFSPKARTLMLSTYIAFYLLIIYKFFTLDTLKVYISGCIYYSNIVSATFFGLAAGYAIAFKERSALISSIRQLVELKELRIGELIAGFRYRRENLRSTVLSILLILGVTFLCYYLKVALITGVLASGFSVGLNIGLLRIYYSMLEARRRSGGNGAAVPAEEIISADRLEECLSGGKLHDDEPAVNGSALPAAFFTASAAVFAAVAYFSAKALSVPPVTAEAAAGIAISLAFNSAALGGALVILADLAKKAVRAFRKKTGFSDPLSVYSRAAFMKHSGAALIIAAVTLSYLTGFTARIVGDETAAAVKALKNSKLAAYLDHISAMRATEPEAIKLFIDNDAYLSSSDQVRILKSSLLERVSKIDKFPGFATAIISDVKDSVNRIKLLEKEHPFKMALLDLFYNRPGGRWLLIDVRISGLDKASLKQCRALIENIDFIKSWRLFARQDSIAGLLLIHPLLRTDSPEDLYKRSFRDTFPDAIKFRLITLGGLARIFYLENGRWPEIEQFRDHGASKYSGAPGARNSIGRLAPVDVKFHNEAGLAAIDPEDGKTMRSQIMPDGSMKFFSLGYKGIDGDTAENIVIVVKKPLN